MAMRTETQDTPCALSSAKKEDHSHDIVHRSRSAHARARSPWLRAQPWGDHHIFYVAVKATLTHRLAPP